MVDVSFGGLSLDGDEEEGLSLGVATEAKESNDISLCLVGRFLTEKPIRVMIMKECMAGIWRPVKGVVIKETSTNLFLFQFSINGIWRVWSEEDHGRLIIIC